MPSLVDGPTTVRFIDDGEGPTALFIHSSGLSARQWKGVFEHLGAGYHLVAPHLLGYEGSGPWDDATFSASDDRAVVEAVLDRQTLPVHLVGHSYGGLLAIELARHRPGAVATLTLMEPVAFGLLSAVGDTAGLADLRRTEHVDFYDEATGGDEAWLARFVAFWNGPGAWERLPEPQKAHWLGVGRKVFREVMEISRHPLDLDYLRALKMPVLVTRGAKTAVASKRVTQLLSELLADAHLVEIPNAGHMHPLRAPDAVAAALTSFWSATRRSQGV